MYCPILFALIRTPSGRVVTVPAREIADAMSAEWRAQKETIDPLTMPLTRFANSVVEAVVDQADLVADDVVKYLRSDLLFYRAGHPEALVALEAKHWDPVLFWAADTLGAHFILAEGIMHVGQPETSVAAARAALPSPGTPTRRPGCATRTCAGCCSKCTARRSHAWAIR